MGTQTNVRTYDQQQDDHAMDGIQGVIKRFEEKFECATIIWLQNAGWEIHVSDKIFGDETLEGAMRKALGG